MYKTVMIDPPWKKSTGGVGHKSLQPSTHYDVQSREEIVATLKRWFEEYGVAPEAHLYMWAVNSFTAAFASFMHAFMHETTIRPNSIIPHLSSAYFMPSSSSHTVIHCFIPPFTIPVW